MCGSWMETCTIKACSSLPFQLSQWRTAWLCLLWICHGPGSSWTHCRSGPACCETMWTSSKLNLMSWEKWSRRVSPALFIVLTWVCKVLRVYKKRATGNEDVNFERQQDAPLHICLNDSRPSSDDPQLCSLTGGCFCRSMGVMNSGVILWLNL